MRPFLSQLQVNLLAFRGLVSDDVMALRSDDSTWEFGRETLSLAGKYFENSSDIDSRVEVGLVNDSSMTATWYKIPDARDTYAIAISRGLVEALRLIAFDIFGHEGTSETKAIVLSGLDSEAAKRLAMRVAAFLELGFPLGDTKEPAPSRRAFVRALVEDALQFVVLHEFAHILLGHDRGNVHLLRSRMVDLQIATFSIGQEHQADKLAARLHSSMRREAARFPGMEFAGPTLFLSLLGMFERYTRYQAAFDSPHAHPNAYERLYRLRVNFSTGDGHMYWPVKSDSGFKTARMNLDPHPEAVQFADAAANSLLSAFEQVEETGTLPSPFNELFNRLAADEIRDVTKHECWREICRWLYLGSPVKVLQHLAEARVSIQAELLRAPPEEDRLFLERSRILIASLVPRIASLDDYSVKRAVQETGLIGASQAHG